ncbi:chondroitin sulfate proteoglycan 5-like isoform X2 [Phycodurus eques]|uniref:chondroitin sulfate proteoglycan 5-like isoform X2 n=1 Tax=Phycodurus eques TaxID=693459 RepID=UPI002ACF05C2|nr:chondroitin sulfate proteoglycan 5-like isoform X2 [Phycodurus eques]
MLPSEEDSSSSSSSISSSSFSSSHARSCAVDCACTPSMETSSCTGSCRRRGTRMARALPPLLLLLHFISVHGVVIATNTTELTAVLNGTAPLSDQDGPTDVSHAVTMGTGPGGSVNTVTPRAGRVPRDGGVGEEQELSSGMFGEAPVPEVGGTLSPSEIGPDSVEAELLLPGNRLPGDVTGEEPVPRSDPPWIHAKDTAVFDLDRPSAAAPPPPATAQLDVLHVDFFDPASRGRNMDLGPRPTSSLAHELQGGDPTSWAMPDSYDYLTPYEDGVSPTSDKYPDSTTDDVGSPARPRPAGPASFLPNGPRRAPPATSPVDGSDGMGGCRPGYQMINATCRSPCDFDPNFCYNGGQCYLLEDSGTFCRCNVQDYIWHKGARCEAVVTEFQVMCLAVGVSAVVVLLLFMMVVCFAKKLHVLKTENKKLRRRSKYRPTSEAHNDNFSLSTIAEGSHPNDDPNSHNKLEEPLKAPAKEDDALNIHNALTPKHDNHKLLGDDDSEVNSLQNNMM